MAAVITSPPPLARFRSAGHPLPQSPATENECPLPLLKPTAARGRRPHPQTRAPPTRSGRRHSRAKLEGGHGESVANGDALDVDGLPLPQLLGAVHAVGDGGGVVALRLALVCIGLECFKR